MYDLRGVGLWVEQMLFCRAGKPSEEVNGNCLHDWG